MDISIIIPALNEVSYIEQTIRSIYKQKSGTYEVEIILVDAGSHDSTVDLVRHLVDKCFINAEFRGAKYKSLNEGAFFATGDALFFLDADCIVPNHFDVQIINTLMSSDILGGAFEFKMNGKGMIFRMIELINRLRYRITRNYYGDQGLFCRRSVFDKIGGFPNEPIMEAAFFCRLLRDQGKLKLIKRCIISSVRRFEEGGVLKVMAKDIEIWMKFLLNIDIKHYASDYWAENEKRK